MAPTDRLPKLFRTTAFTATLLQIVVLAVATAVVVVVLLVRINGLLGEQVVEILRTEAQGLLDISRSAGMPAVLSTIEERMRRGGPGLYIVVNADERKIAGNLNRWPPELDEHTAGGLFRFVSEGADGGEHLAAGLPFELGGGYRLIVGRDIEQQRTLADQFRWLMVSGLAVLAAAGIGAGVVVSRYVLGRISTVTGTADQIMAGDLARRIPLSGSGDEIDDLAGRLNAMLDRIEQLLTGMREISDNIAHDLKTPLTRLRNRAEGALRDPAGGPAYRDGLQEIIEAADEIIKTFNSLLLIARLEAGAPDSQAETFDIAKAVADLVDLYAPVAEDGGLALSTDLPAHLAFFGNRQLIVQAVANLVENAIKYAGPEAGKGMVGIRLVSAGTSVAIEVADRGPGVPPQDRQRVMERFVRLDESRSKPGTGLGLALVAAVARIHGGDVRLRDNDPGLVVELRLKSGYGKAEAADG